MLDVYLSLMHPFLFTKDQNKRDKSPIGPLFLLAYRILPTFVALKKNNNKVNKLNQNL